MIFSYIRNIKALLHTYSTLKESLRSLNSLILFSPLQVKSDVHAIEEEMLSVRDELDTERVKMNKLEKLVQQYSSSSSSSSSTSMSVSVSTATTASKGTFRSSGHINSYNNNNNNNSGSTSGVRSKIKK